MIIDFETIFWTIVACAVLIIIFNWWLFAKSDNIKYLNFKVSHQGGDKRTEMLEEIQGDLRKIKEKLDIHY